LSVTRESSLGLKTENTFFERGSTNFEGC
jgi:hypothetical protein